MKHAFPWAMGHPHRERQIEERLHGSGGRHAIGRRSKDEQISRLHCRDDWLLLGTPGAICVVFDAAIAPNAKVIAIAREKKFRNLFGFGNLINQHFSHMIGAALVILSVDDGDLHKHSPRIFASHCGFFVLLLSVKAILSGVNSGFNMSSAHLEVDQSVKNF